MAYQSWSVVFGEQPSATKWNILGTNDASFNDGTGIGVDTITPLQWTNPYCFSANSTAAQNSGNGAFAKTLFATEEYDYNSNYATSRFTCTVGGVYHFNACVETTASAAILILALFKNGSEVKRGMDDRQAATVGGSAIVSADVLLVATDYIEVYCYGNTTLALGTTAAEMYFSGHLVRAT